jgi:hypothetical protein
MYQCEFRVKGAGHFPIDMLRYDAAHPRTSDDAASVAATPADWPGAREIELIRREATKRNCKPTAARWASFGWRVVETRPAYKVS